MGKKRQMDSDMASVLQAQVKEREMKKMQEAEEQRQLALRFKAEAEEYSRFKAEERKGKIRAQQAVKEMLNQQLVMREMQKQEDRSMNNVELRINAHLLKEVLDTGAAGVPDELAVRIQAQAAVQAD